jgi:hypothetical protein
MRLCRGAAPVYHLLGQSQEESILCFSNSVRKWRSLSVNRRRIIVIISFVLFLALVAYNFITSEIFLHRVINIR